MSETVFVGIDVSKERLDVATSTARTWWCANQEGDFQELIEQLQAERIELIVLEASGGYEGAVVASLSAAGLPVVVVNPRQVRDFAKACGDWRRRIGSMQGYWRCLPSASSPSFAR